MLIDDEHVRAWISTREVKIMDGGRSALFAAYLDVLNWNSVGTGLDWSLLPSVEIDLNEPATASRIATSRLARHEHVFVFYHPAEPGLVVPFAGVIESLDELFPGTAGRQYLCGADVHADQVQLALEDLAEYDGGQRVTLRV